MSIILPNQEQPQVVSGEQKEGRNFPSIFRFITEYRFSERHSMYAKLFIVSFFSGVLIISIALQTSRLQHNLTTIQSMNYERGRLAEEIVYWKQVSQQYTGYRDVYFRIAALEYKIGNTNESTRYMEKALEVDPNFEAGRVLGEKIKEQ